MTCCHMSAIYDIFFAGFQQKRTSNPFVFMWLATSTIDSYYIYHLGIHIFFIYCNNNSSTPTLQTEFLSNSDKHFLYFSNELC